MNNMKSVRLFPAAILAAFLALPGLSLCAAQPETVTNVEITKLLGAEMPEEVILTVIRTAKAKDFDTSADALLALKQAGASANVIKAMLGAPMPEASVADTSAPATSADAWEPNDVYTSADGQIIQLCTAPAEIRSAVRGLGFGGAGMYAVLKGSSALQSTDSKPVFLAAIPKNAQAGSYFTLASFAVRRNGDREVLVANTHMTGMRIGIPRERVIAVQVTKAEDQSHAGKNTVIYEIIPVKPLPAGQYALLSNLGQTGLGQMSGNYYDFSVQ